MKSALLVLVSFTAGAGSWAGWTAYHQRSRRPDLLDQVAGDRLRVVHSEPLPADDWSLKSRAPHVDLDKYGIVTHDPEAEIQALRLRVDALEKAAKEK